MKQILLALLFISIFSCKKKLICSAYNTYFIHDESVREEYYSPFLVDSLSSSNDENQENNVESKNSKFKPQNKYIIKKQASGVLVSSKKNQNRNNTDLEMRIVMVKPLSRYSQADSTLDSKEPKLENKEAVSDTL